MRTQFNGGQGLSQEALAAELGIAANTVSRWETGQYQPSLRELERLSRFFGVSILEFFPGQKVGPNEKLNALLRAAGDLPESDLRELQRFAEFRKAQAIYPAGRPSAGRRSKARKAS